MAARRRLWPHHTFQSRSWLRSWLRTGQGFEPRRRFRLERPHVVFPEWYRLGQRIPRGCRPRYDGFARCRRSSHNVRLHHHIAWTADHEEMLDIVTAHKDETAPAIDIGLIDYGQSWLAPASAGVSQSLTAKPAQKPQCEREDAKNDNKGEQQLDGILSFAE